MAPGIVLLRAAPNPKQLWRNSQLSQLLQSWNCGLRRWKRRRMAPRVGFEPTTNWLTANCSTAELPRNGEFVTARNGKLLSAFWATAVYNSFLLKIKS